jgi:glycosyltransferase involved in cell wall biosynthesis
VEPLISICIPTYREEHFIAKTITRLSRQTFFPYSEIVIADYDPDATTLTKNAITMASKSGGIAKQVRVVNCSRGGIGYQRNVACQAAKGLYLVCMDADSYFESDTSIGCLVSPLTTGEAVMSCCNHRLDKKLPSGWEIVYDAWEACRDIMNYVTFAREPGLTLSADAFYEVGGFNDTNVAEGTLMDLKITHKFGISKRRYFPYVYVIASARRIEALERDGLGVYNWNKGYRAGGEAVYTH